MPRRSKTEDMVYNFVCENPGKSTYYISKKMRMSGGKVRHALMHLNKIGLIKFKFERRSPRIRKLSFPVDALSLIPKGIKKNLKKIIKR